jgi:uncharacterized protein
MQINMSELFSAEGISKTWQLPVEQTEIRWNGNRYSILDAGPISLTITHVGNRNMKITGTVDLQVGIPCDRCLELVKYPFHLTLDREIDTNATDEERIAALDEQPFVQGYLLDADRLVYDELIVNMPMKVLCRQDCKGVCPKCGANRNVQDCGCDLTQLDPRMSVIRDIFSKSSRKDS